jgi:hypothetical protein
MAATMAATTATITVITMIADADPISNGLQ